MSTRLKSVCVSFIPGFMVGIEWAYNSGFLIIDLGIIRIAIDYEGVDIG